MLILVLNYVLKLISKSIKCSIKLVFNSIVMNVSKKSSKGFKSYLWDDTQFFIQISLDQPRAHEFTKYIGQPSPALRLESARARLWS